MRRAIVVLVAVALTLALAAALLRRDPGGGRVAAPPASGSITGEASGPASAPSTTSTPARRSGPPDTAAPALERARDVLAAIEAHHGQPLAGYVGGRVFHNREARLPVGRYHEYDVHPRTPGQDRGPERLVIDQVTGRAYYSADHYRTFVPLN